MKEAERPRGQGEEKQDESIRILTPAQLNAFLAQVDAQKYRTLFLLAVFTGARQGELLGLKWGDIEWTACQINIQRSFNKGRFFATKTKTSNRPEN